MSNVRRPPSPRSDSADRRTREFLVRVLIEQLTKRYEEAFGPTLERPDLRTEAQIRSLAARLATDANATPCEGILRESISMALLEARRWSYDPYHAALSTIDYFATALSVALRRSPSESEMWWVVAIAYRELSEWDMPAADVTFFVDKTGLDIVDVSIALAAAVSIGVLRRNTCDPKGPGFYSPAICDPIAT